MTLKVITILIVSLTSFVWGWTARNLVEARRKEKQAKKKLEELLAKIGPPPKWPKVNPHLPLKQRPLETTEEFVDRVQEKLEDGELTPNAARLSLGLKPIDELVLKPIDKKETKK